MTCHCPNICPDCGARFVVTSLCHDHRATTHGHTCQEDQK